MKSGATASDPRPSPLKDNRLEAQRLATRWWRRWTLLYFILLTVGTHWPRLTIGTGTGPPPDKILHLFAFGGLTLLLWQCRLIKNKWLLGLIVTAWVVFDEISQSLPILKRETSWEDIVAGCAGIVCAVLLLWSTSPMRGHAAQIRRQLFHDLVDTKLATFGGWFRLGTRAIFDGIIAAIVSLMLILQTNKDPFITVLIAYSAGFIFGVYDAMIAWWVEPEKALNSRLKKWKHGLKSPWSWVLAILITVITFLIATKSPLDQLPDPLETVARIVLLFPLLAIFIRELRRHSAIRFAREPLKCVKCGYNLRGHYFSNSSTVCPECGTQFARLHSDADTGR